MNTNKSTATAPEPHDQPTRRGSRLIEHILRFTICFALLSLLKLEPLARNSVHVHDYSDALNFPWTERSLKESTNDFNGEGTSAKNPIQAENSLPGSPNWILSKPAPNREVEGYMSRTSILAGQNISLFYSSRDSQHVTIEVFRTGWYNGIGARQLLGPIKLPGIDQEMPRPGKDGLIVCNWKDPYVLTTSEHWTTGVYLVKLTESTSNYQSYAIFVLRGLANNQAEITFQLPVNTYQAYNYWGGKNLYGCRDGKNCIQARKVSFDRPYAAPENSTAAHGSGAGEYLVNVQPLGYPISTVASWNYNMVRWMEKHGLDVTYVTNTDVHRANTMMMDGFNLTKPKLFISQGHDEYWSWEMRDHVTKWRDDHGVNLAFLGSNTAYWQIRYEDIDTTLGVEDEPRTVVCFRRPHLDPVKSERRTVKFRQVRPEALMVGVQYVFPLGDPFDEDMIVFDDAHWLFNGTGVVKGDKIPGLLGYEVDHIPDNLSPKEGNAEEAIPIGSVAKLFETPLVTRKNQPIRAHGAMYNSKSGALVFGAGTMQWSWGLDDYGVTEGYRSSRLSPVIEKMTWNLLRASGISNIANDGEVVSANNVIVNANGNADTNTEQTKVPGEGWIFEPKNLGYFWKKMGDRPFLRELYSHVGKYSRVIDVGARGYNRYCKELINSTTTTYYQIEPFPPSQEEINNDGLLDCYMQEVPNKYPELKHSFDLLLDFGVLGWKPVLDSLSEVDKQKYVESVAFLLKDEGVWALKTDVGFVENVDEFFGKYILAHHFSSGDFEGYKSGHTIKNGKWKFYFFHKKKVSVSVQ